MRIGLVIERFDPQRGGAESWTFLFAERLIALGHELHVAAMEFSPETARLPIVPHILPATRDKLAFAAAAEAAMRPLNLDIVHDMGAGWFGDVSLPHDGSRAAQAEYKLAALPAWARPWKRLMMAVLPRYRTFRRLSQRQFADPRRIHIAMSRMTAEHFRRFHGVPAERIRVVHHGVDTERFSPEACRPLRQAARARLGLDEADVVFAFLGHDYHRKGLEPAIRALAVLAAGPSRSKLLVVGGRKEQPGFVRLAKRLGVADRVLFEGPQPDPLPCYAAADAVLLPSFYDPFGLVALEGASCGLPVIVSRAAGAHELFIDGRDGLLLDDPADIAALADRMYRLEDPAQRLPMAAAARAMAERHTFRQNCDAIVAIYEEILRRKDA